MSNLTGFMAALRDWANRQDWSDDLVQSFIWMAQEKLNSELRIDRMIKFNEATVVSRCAPLPDDWLQMELVRINNSNVPDGFMPIRYKSRDEFFTTNDQWMYGFYTIQGRQIFVGGTPDAINGQTLKITYYGEVPDFVADDDNSWVWEKYGTLLLYASLMHADLHAVGEEDKAAQLKQLVEDMINKLNAQHQMSRASGSRITRSRVRSFG